MALGRTESRGTSVYMAIAPAMHVIDVGPLAAGDEEVPGVYVATKRVDFHGAAPEGKGAAFSYSRDSGSSFTVLSNGLDTTAVMGLVTQAASSTATAVGVDRASTIHVTLLNSEDVLTSTTAAGLANGKNIAIMGQEVIQFQTATAVSAPDGKYALTNLVRGLRGTEDQIGAAAVHTIFTLYSPETVKLVKIPIELAGVSHKYAATSAGGVISVAANTYSTNTTDVALQLRTIKPYAVADLAGSRDASNNLTITWERRTRSHVRLLGYSGRPLGEDREAYEVDVMSGSTVKRTISVTAETASYTASQQTTDSFTPGDAITVRVYQLSHALGRGLKKEGAI